MDFWTRSQVRNYTRDNLWVVIIDPLCTLKISHSPYMYPAVSWSCWHPHSATLFVALYFWWSLVIPQNNYYLLWKTTTCRLWPQIFFEVIHVVYVSGFINCHHIGIDIWEGGSDCNFQITFLKGALYTILYMIIIIVTLLLSCQNGVETDNEVHSLTYQCPYNTKRKIQTNSSRKLKVHKFSFKRFYNYFV